MGKIARAAYAGTLAPEAESRKAKTLAPPASALRAKAARREPLDAQRAECVGKVARERFDEELDAALKRRPTNEAKLAGALRAVAPVSPHVRGRLAEVLRTLLRRRTLDRELYPAAIRSLAECGDKATGAILRDALGADDAGGTPALCAAAACSEPELGPLLSKIAASRQSHLAFSAEVARVARGEANGSHLLALAPMIKESHRIALCVELFVPLARGASLPRSIARALHVLGEAERHLGRWLVLGEVATKTGDRAALEQADSREKDGPSSSRAAWALARWALQDVAAGAPPKGGADGPRPPDVRPTVELVARLSDRPSANRDMTFLFRLARAKAPGARGMLEALAKSSPLSDETAVRAAMHLARDYGRDDLRRELGAVARGERREDLRGLAAAALWDAGDREVARGLEGELVASRSLANVVWGSLLRAAALRAGAGRELLCTEERVRWVHAGWLE